MANEPHRIGNLWWDRFARRLTPDPRNLAYIYDGWLGWSYCAQGFGILWIAWGLGLTVWTVATQGTPKFPLMFMLVIGPVLTVPSAVMFFGAARFRAWVRGRVADLEEQDEN
ncbi:MAG: hypothetical protein P4L87_10435 [Formivibrio sp.]|nr:hypothetical protein [Formivibrio sp.]